MGMGLFFIQGISFLSIKVPHGGASILTGVKGGVKINHEIEGHPTPPMPSTRGNPGIP